MEDRPNRKISNDEPMVRYNTGRVNNGWHVDDILRNNGKIQRAAALMGRTRDSLRQVNRIKEFSQANGIRVERVLDVHIEMTADDERAAE